MKVCIDTGTKIGRGEWQHSCIYDKKDNGGDHVWCATSVDDNGVMIQEEVGDCVDERNTVYAGPGKKKV